MADANIKSNTGNAQIVQQGHTTNSSFGSDPNMQVKGRSTTPRDLTINSK